MRKNRGITLISLVVTVLVILILTSISVYSGIGTIRYTKFNKAKNEMEYIQSTVNLWNEKYRTLKTSQEKKEYIDTIGEPTEGENSTCDATALTKTVQATGIIAGDYRFLPASYLNNNLGMNSSNEFLVNISNRSVILFNGLRYQEKYYYTTDDFGILNVTDNTEASRVSFQLVQNEAAAEIIIYNLVFSDNAGAAVNVSKFKVLISETGTNSWIDVSSSVTETTYNDSKAYLITGLNYNKSYDVKITTTDDKINENNNETIFIAVRPGIEVGDYVTYVPPKNNGAVKSYLLTAGASGYSSDQTLTQQYNVWRVLNKNPDGTLDIMPAFTDSGVTYTAIYFQDAKGWNNAPYLLDDMCKTLYEAPNDDSKKAITARSIDYEDITSHMIEGVEGATSEASTGLKKISKYQSEQVAALSTGDYIDSIDTSTNTVTYKNGRTSHPTSYFDVKDDLSNPFYTAGTIDTNSSSNGRIASKPATLPVKYTYYYGTILSSDFTNSNAHSVIFGTGTTYWLASRCVNCRSNYAIFRLRFVNGSALSGYYVFDSSGSSTSSGGDRVSPVVTLGSNVQVTKCTGENSPTNRHTVVVPN